MSLALHIEEESEWEGIVDQNRQTLYDTGLWGQDRLWLFAREIQRQLERRQNQ